MFGLDVLDVDDNFSLVSLWERRQEKLGGTGESEEQVACGGTHTHQSDTFHLPTTSAVVCRDMLNNRAEQLLCFWDNRFW